MTLERVLVKIQCNENENRIPGWIRPDSYSHWMQSVCLRDYVHHSSLVLEAWDWMRLIALNGQVGFSCSGMLTVRRCDVILVYHIEEMKLEPFLIQMSWGCESLDGSITGDSSPQIMGVTVSSNCLVGRLQDPFFLIITPWCTCPFGSHCQVSVL